MKLNKNKIILSLITLLTIFTFVISVFSAETESIDEQLEQLKNILDSSFTYSAFQTTMLLKSAQNLIESGVLFEDTKIILKSSVEKSLDAYSIKKFFDVILEAQQEGLPTKPLISKINEGFAKNINKTIIISVISIKAKNLRKATEILNEARQEGLEIDDGEEMVKILADGLENDVPQESLSWLVKTGTAEGRSIKEIGEISEELSYLSLLATDSGLSPEKIYLLFKKAIENSSNIGEICENIQKNLEAEISTAKIEGEEGKPSTVSDNGILPVPSVETPVNIGETPNAGEAPTETDSALEPSTSPTEEGAVPPGN